MQRDSHKHLDVCLELSHVNLDPTTLTALLLCQPDAVSLRLPSHPHSPRPLRRLAAEDVLTGIGHS